MKSRLWQYALVVLFALGAALLLYSAAGRESPAILEATARRDCAPWDGMAFTVSIPSEFGSTLQVSIWQPPEIPLPITFSFPGAEGAAVRQPKFGPAEQLSGSVTFRRVEPDLPVHGEFDLRAPDGTRFRGTFEAPWDEAVVACG